MRSIIWRLVAVAVSVLGFGAAALAPAAAATGPRVFSAEQAGYAATGARFRYIETTFRLPDATTFNSELGADNGGVGLSVQLISSENTWLVLSFNTTTASGVWAASWANEFNAGGCPGPFTGFAGSLGPNGWAVAGNLVTIKEFYNRTTGKVRLTAVDDTTGESHFTDVSVPTTQYTQARVGAEFGQEPCQSAGTYTPPANATKLRTFRATKLTTYGGFRSGLSAWWTHSKVFMTNDGTPTGKVEVIPHGLWNGGHNFGVYLQP